MHKLKIFTVYHKPSVMLKNDIYEPVHVGKALSDTELGFIGDDTGENISDLNPYFCELTGMYWVWKNYNDSEYVGFCHYRRLFCFKEGVDTSGLDISNFIQCEHIDNDLYDKIGIHNAEDAYRLLEDHDLILPIKINTVQWGGKNIFGQVGHIPQLNYRQYDKTPYFAELVELYKQTYPEMAELIERTIFKQSYGYYYNIFIMKLSVFKEFCGWLFPVLFKYHESVDYTSFSQAEMRMIGFFAERMLNVYINYLIDSGKVKSVKEIPVIFVNNPEALTSLEQKKSAFAYPSDRYINVAIPLDHSTSKYCLLTIESLLQHKSSREYHISLLDNGGDQYYIKLIETLLNKHRIRYDILQITLSPKYSYDISAVNFIRLLNEDRILFIKAGSLLCADPLELYESVGEHMISAVNDIDVYGNLKSDRSVHGLTWGQYVGKVLKTVEQSYFDDTVMVMNTGKIREKNIDYDHFFDSSASMKEALNKMFAGDVCVVDYAWNVRSAVREAEKAPYGIYKAYRTAMQSPKILTFYGPGGFMPYNSDVHEDLFWEKVDLSRYLHIFINHASEENVYIDKFDARLHEFDTYKSTVNELQKSVNGIKAHINTIKKLPFVKKIWFMMGKKS